MLFEIAELEEIAEVVLWTSAVKGAAPVSLIIIGPSGTAKSALIKQYKSAHIFGSDSITSQGLWDTLQPDVKNVIRYITVPDFNPTLSRKPSTVLSTVANLLTVTYDGTLRINDGRREKICTHDPVGVITAVTPEIYRQHARRWLWLGIRRRIIPIFFTYSQATIGKLQDFTSAGKIHSMLDGNKQFAMPESKFTVAIPEKESLQLQAASVVFASLLGKYSTWDKTKKQLAWSAMEVVPISPHVTLRSLVEANARRAKRGTIGQQDIDFVRRFLSYCDPERPRII